MCMMYSYSYKYMYIAYNIVVVGIIVIVEGGAATFNKCPQNYLFYWLHTMAVVMVMTGDGKMKGEKDENQDTGL